jgi:hypothetical protein
MRRLCLFLLFFLPIALWAQDITGIWQGHFRSKITSKISTIFDDRYRCEVQIAQKGKKFEGVTYSYLSSIFYGKAAATGTFNPKSGKVYLQEGKLLELRDQFDGGACVMTYFLQYSKSGNDEYLEGTYVSMNVRDSGNCGRGTVFLHKVPNSFFYTEPVVERRQKEIEDSARNKPLLAARKPIAHAPTTSASLVKKPASDSGTAKTGVGRQNRTPGPATASTPVPRESTNQQPRARAAVPGMSLTRPAADSITGTGIGRKFPSIVPAVLKDRENQPVRTLVIHTNEVTLNIYDDGAIDHDTVSVYLDNRQVVNHAMLTDRPIVVTLHLDEDNAYHEIVMVAENEGEIPPNTSLMIVKAGDKEYEVRITTTEQKNAVIKFQYAK